MYNFNIGDGNMQKNKLTISEQIEYMKKEKGIKFNIINEQDAEEFLHKSTYYFKLKAYAKNFSKYTQENSPKINQYINLEFAYLKELSIIDSNFRKIILNMVLDIEHFLKVQLIADFSENPDEDGYKIINSFLTLVKPNLRDELLKKSTNSYCFELIDKYKDNFAIWNLIEVISFGEFIELYEYYYSFYENKYNINGKLLPIKWLRNAAAHNNCLLHKLVPPYSKDIVPNQQIMRKLSQIKYMPRKTRESKMKNPIIHDFVVLLDVYCTIIKSKKTVAYGIKILSDFINNRCLKHKDYFENNDVLKSNYEFLKKVVDFYEKNAYNT